MDIQTIKAVEEVRHLIEQDKTEDEALAHAFQRFGIGPVKLREALSLGSKIYDDI
jgi:hypothetical protein